MPEISALVLEDRPSVRDSIVDFAKEAGFTAVHPVKDLAEGFTVLDEQAGVDTMVIDLNIDGDLSAGMNFLRQGNSIRLVHAIIYSAHLAEMRGELDQLRAEIGEGKLSIFRKPLDESDLRDKLREVAGIIKRRNAEKVIRDSVADKKLEEQIRWFAKTDLPVLITGPTGVGKESFAREVALWSGRDADLTRTVNCGAVAETLVMSELFGHVRGAFTGADRNRLGLILEVSGYMDDGTAGSYKRSKTTGGHEPKSYLEWLSSDGRKPEEGSAPNGERCFHLPESVIGGTLILDEVAELSWEAQAAMLRVLDGLPIRPVGYDGPGFLPNLRIIAVTNDERKLRSESEFRPDLLARLEGWHFIVGKLSERKETAEGVVHKTIKEMVFRDDGGNPVRHSFGIRSEALADILDSVPGMVGGVRQLIWMVQRACTFAYMERKDQVEIAHVLKAKQSGFLWAGREGGDSPGENEGVIAAGLVDPQEVSALRREIEKFFEDKGCQLPEQWSAEAFKHALKPLAKDAQSLEELKTLIMVNRGPEVYTRAFGPGQQKRDTMRKWFKPKN